MAEQNNDVFESGAEYFKENYERLFRGFFYSIWVSVVIYIPTFFILGSSLTAYLFMATSLVVFPILFALNLKKPHPLYKMLFIFICYFLIYFPTVSFAEAINGEYYYICMLMIAVILFNRRQNSYLYTCVAGALVSWLLGNMLHYKFVNVTIHLKFVTYEAFQQFNFIGSFLLSLILLKIMIRSREELEVQKDLFAKNSKLASIGELAAGVGHEINNPLTIANGFIMRVSMVLENDGYKSEEVDMAIEKYYSAADRIRKIVDGLRIYACANRVDKTKFDIVKSIEDTVSLVDEIYKKDGIEIVWDRPKQSALVNADLGQIQQAFMNLLSNARDANLEGKSGASREIRVDLSVDGESVKVSVADYGDGIPKEIQSKIFDSFFTTKEVGKGTGMGLSISHSIIDSFGGELSFRSEQGKGTVFTISLPLATD